MVVMKANEAVLESMNKVPKVFARGLEAKKRDKTGRQVHDVATQLRTVDTMRSFAEMGQPRAPVVQQNQQFNYNGGRAGFAPGMSFESRLRTIRERRGLSNGDEEDTVLEGEVVDEVQSLEEELEGIGIDLDDADEDSDAASAKE